MPVPPMPPRHGRWRASTQKAWTAWFTSGRASLLDDAGRTALERLMRLVDDADREGWPREMAREVRLQEAHLMAKVAPSAMPSARGSQPMEEHERSQQLRAEQRASPAHPANWTELTAQDVAKVELSALMPEAQEMDVSTPAGRMACIRAYDRAEAHMEVSHVGHEGHAAAQSQRATHARA